MPKVEFVSYTGKYPNLCNGILTVKIDEKEFKFGHDYLSSDWKDDGNYGRFWISGGRTSIDSYTESARVDVGPWDIDISDLDEEFWPVADQLIHLFNENVDPGCCGGCC